MSKALFAGLLAAIVVPSLARSASDKPSWFGPDTRDKQGFTFYCESSAAEEGGTKGAEKAALALAEAECSRKMCMLFGVEVDYQQTSRETLKDAGVDSVIKESCPKVRIVGRTTKKKNLECDDGNCTAFISQFYPLSEYQSEKKRLDNPPIAKEFEKTIIVREGNETFRDPKECRKALAKYAKATGVVKERRDARIESLAKAAKDCKGIDYRNSELQNELMGLLFANITKRPVSFAQLANQTLMAQPTLTAKIDALAELEKGGGAKGAEAAKRVLRAYYDALYYREFPMEGARFKLPGGRLVDVHPYLEEMKTCDGHTAVARKWPKGFTDDITVCLKKESGDGEDCQTTSMIMVRAAFAGCVCNLGNKERAGSCTQTLLTHLNEECPSDLNEACFKEMSKTIAEEMKIHIHSSRSKK